jgi:hypothetical protein
MKSSMKITGGLLISAGLIVLSGLIHGQEATLQTQSILNGTDLTTPDSVVRVVADSQGLPLVPPDQIPKFGTFWIVSGSQLPPPFPFLPPEYDPASTPVFSLGPEGQFLVDATDGVVPQPTARQAMLDVNTATLVQAQVNMLLGLIGQVQGAQASAQTTATMSTSGAMSPMDAPSPSDNNDSGGTNTYSDPSYTAPNYGTNLWIANFALSSGNAVGTVSNTTADVSYEIQYVNDLTSTQWLSGGFILGSELTNWTAMVMTNALSYTNNLFLRIRSWASSDGSGLPDWWEILYFGHTGINPNALDSAGDGWTIWQKFQMGLNPNVFYTPPAPQGLTASYDAGSSTATVSWQPSAGAVTGYTVQKHDAWTGLTTNYNFGTNISSFVDNVSADVLDPQWGDILMVSYEVQAHYGTLGDSAWAGPAPLDQKTLVAAFIAGPQGSAYVAVPIIPPGSVTLQVTRFDEYAWIQYDWYGGNAPYVTNFTIPVSSSTNGLYLIPPSWCVMPPDAYGSAYDYQWSVQTLNTNGLPTATGALYKGYYFGVEDNRDWLVPPYFDGRAQLKQNLIFLLRAAPVDTPFVYLGANTNNFDIYNFTNPPGYVYAGFYQLDENVNDPFLYESPGSFDAYWPFENNYRYRNFVFNATNLDSNGRITTGAGGNYGGNYIPGSGFDGGYGDFAGGLYLLYPTSSQFQPPATNGATIPSLLATNQTKWLASYAIDSPFYWLWKIGATNSGGVNGLFNNVLNWYGLPIRSVNIGYNNGSSFATNVLTAGNTTTAGGYGGYFYPETTQPQFQTVEYDFWNANWPYNDLLPGQAGFSPANKSRLLITSVGITWFPVGYIYGPYAFRVNGYAKLTVTNSYYNGVYGYLGQYFDQAYTMTNGIATTNTTGVLSPYGDFFATQPGPAALVTMPDLDTGARGTCTVYCVSLVLDANHDGTMDTTFNGPDATSQARPMECWVNDGHDQPGVNGNLDTDLEVPPASTNYTAGKITCPRDLENFFRLWICGLPQLPAGQGYAVTMSMSPSSGNPAVNLYWSCESDGGMGYLTNTSIASMQTTAISINGGPLTGYGVAIGTVSNNLSYTFPDGTFQFGGTLPFLFEGAGIGSGELVLTIAQNGNFVAQTGVWLDLHDIKDFYERVGITNNTSGAISNWSSTIEEVQQSTTSALGSDTNLIVFVHGINVGPWDWLDESDTVFKRLYWAGYQGKFATVRWPCELINGWAFLMQDYLVFNDSEMNAYIAGAALKTYVDQLHARFPGYRLHLLVHSQGNSVVSEAIRQGAEFDTYILTQGALPASSYDANSPLNTFLVNYESTWGPTPEWQPMGYRGVYTNFAGQFTGQIVNFYNTNDPVLAVWVTDQGFAKPNTPNTDYTYDGTNGWYHELFSKYLVTDPQESRAYVSRSRTLSIGQSGPASAHGVIQSAVDLNANYGFNDAFPDDHSAQWTWPIQTTRPYFRQVLISCQIQPAP